MRLKDEDLKEIARLVDEGFVEDSPFNINSFDFFNIFKSE